MLHVALAGRFHGASLSRLPAIELRTGEAGKLLLALHRSPLAGIVPGGKRRIRALRHRAEEKSRRPRNLFPRRAAACVRNRASDHRRIIWIGSIPDLVLEKPNGGERVGLRCARRQPAKATPYRSDFAAIATLLQVGPLPDLSGRGPTAARTRRASL